MNKIKSYKLKATIPISRFANLKPEIELETNDISKAQKFAMQHIKELYQFSSEPIQIKTERKILKSFNENIEIELDELHHKYFYKSIQLLSATQYLKQFYDKFDAETISKMCEIPWGVPAQDIQNMWLSNGNLAGDFGTVIHKALEHYFLFKEIGEIIQENKNLEKNPALPKHPFIQKIILEFEKIDKYKGELKTEVLISDVNKKRCGMIDRLLITGKKTCRVQDYKVNINSEEENKNLKIKTPFNELPPTKLTKYQIQMSFYANILQESGWKVEGLDVFILEDKWKHYELDVLSTF